jgi:hypothetical protein
MRELFKEQQQHLEGHVSSVVSSAVKDGLAGLQKDVSGLRKSYDRLQKDVSCLREESAQRAATHLLGPLYAQPARQQSLAQLVDMLPLREDEDVLQQLRVRLARTLRVSNHLLQEGIPQKLLSALQSHLQVYPELHACLLLLPAASGG